MMYESDEHVVVQTPIYRYWPYVEEVQAVGARIRVPPRRQEGFGRAAVSRLAERHIGYRIVTVGDYYAVLPDSGSVLSKPVRNRG